MDIECTICDELIETAPDLATYGEITDTMCNSLKNDTGLNPSLTTLHTDCEDYDTMNDCLVGRPDADLEKYESCEWRKFMHKWIPNVHTMFKGIICGICGIWENIHSLTNRVSDLEDRVDDLCELLNQQINQNMDVYGVLPGTGFDSADARKGGEINTINGEPALIIGQHGAWDGVGFYYKKSLYRNCAGEVKTYEWFQPYLRNYQYNTQVSFNDCIWKCPVSKLREWGWTESLIAWLRDWPQWWGGYSRSWGLQFESSLYAQIIGDNLEIWIIGASDNTLSGYTIDGLTKDPVLRVS